jgi:hypothetical protein
MIRSLSRDFRLAARFALRAGGSLLVLAACLARPLPAGAAPPSLLAQHQAAQAGLTVGMGLNLVAQLASIVDEALSTGCSTSLGTTSVMPEHNTVGNFTAAAVVVYYDPSCRTPYLTDTFEFTGQLQTPGQSVKLKSARQLLAPNGAILGALALLENYDEINNNVGSFSGIGTYGAVANPKAPLVHVGFACGESAQNFNCQVGAAQDFPSLKTALGSIAQLRLTLTSAPQGVGLEVTSTGVYLATGALGHLSIDLATPTTLGFAGKHTLTLGGTAGGSSPQYSPIFPSGTKWGFNDSAQGLSFSLNTASTLTSSGKIVDTPTHATLATLTLDKSGTGAISYSDHSTAPITSWTLGD